jgi:hypothetical protein
MWSSGRKTEGGSMPRKGHTEEQIVYALRQAEAGKKVSEIVREMGGTTKVLQLEAAICRSADFVARRAASLRDDVSPA